jgi:hypothetical protein
MSIAVELSPETEAAVRERAEAAGEAPAAYIARAVETHVREEKITADRERWQAKGLNYTLADAIARRANRTPEEIEAAREEAFRHVIPGLPLPPGKTLEDMVAGKWPGDETDEEIAAALEQLS